MWIEFALEGLVAILLLITIAYCFVLDKRLKALRSGEDGLREVILGLNDATLRAQQSIAQLKEAGGEAGQDIAQKLRDGRALADELALMVESGNNLANRLEEASGLAGSALKNQTARSGNREPQRGTIAQERPMSQPARAPVPRSAEEAGAEILKALQRAR